MNIAYGIYHEVDADSISRTHVPHPPIPPSLCHALPQDAEVKLDAAAAESAAMLRRCEELRLAYENATASKQELEEEVSILRYASSYMSHLIHGRSLF